MPQHSRYTRYYGSSMENFSKIEDLEGYFKDFNISRFIETILIKPSAWNRSKIGGDDSWGVDLIFNESFYADPYFWLNDLLWHSDLKKLWEESAYTSGTEQQIIIEKGGMVMEKEYANKVQEEIRQKVLSNYQVDDHYECLKIINNLSDVARNELSKVYFENEIEGIIFLTAAGKCMTQPFKSWSSYDLVKEGIVELVKNDFFKNIWFEVNVITRKETILLKFSQPAFKEFLSENDIYSFEE